MEVKKASK